MIGLMTGCVTKITDGPFDVAIEATGVSGTVIVRESGDKNLTITEDGNYSFGRVYLDGDKYCVTIHTSPTAQTCTLEDACGVIDHHDAHVRLRCQNTPEGGNPNQNPIAKAGPDQHVEEGTEVTLDGSASHDPDGTIVSYSWKDGPIPIGDTVQISKADFTVGVHNVTLKVTDDDGATGSDTATITVTAPEANHPPTAEASLTYDQPDNGTDGRQCNYDASTNHLSVTLDGSASSDPDGDTLTYRWTGVQGETIDSNTSATASTSLNALCQDCRDSAEGEPRECLHVFTLEVSDGNATDTTDVNITVEYGPT